MSDFLFGMLAGFFLGGFVASMVALWAMLQIEKTCFKLWR
jgi:hypothetical protein